MCQSRFCFFSWEEIIPETYEFVSFIQPRHGFGIFFYLSKLCVGIQMYFCFIDLDSKRFGSWFTRISAVYDL